MTEMSQRKKQLMALCSSWVTFEQTMHLCNTPATLPISLTRYKTKLWVLTSDLGRCDSVNEFNRRRRWWRTSVGLL